MTKRRRTAASIDALRRWHRRQAWSSLRDTDYDYLIDNGWGGHTEEGRIMPRPGPLKVTKFVRLDPTEAEEYQAIADKEYDGQLSVMLRVWIREGANNRIRRQRRKAAS